jgi:hypothetical protein
MIYQKLHNVIFIELVEQEEQENKVFVFQF